MNLYAPKLYVPESDRKAFGWMWNAEVPAVPDAKQLQYAVSTLVKQLKADRRAKRGFRRRNVDDGSVIFNAMSTTGNYGTRCWPVAGMEGFFVGDREEVIALSWEDDGIWRFEYGEFDYFRDEGKTLVRLVHALHFMISRAT